MLIDLHALPLPVNVVIERLPMIKRALVNQEVKPNSGDSHIVKIVAGAGKHSKGKAVVKYAVC
jgi:hypothetical protein